MGFFKRFGLDNIFSSASEPHAPEQVVQPQEQLAQVKLPVRRRLYPADQLVDQHAGAVAKGGGVQDSKQKGILIEMQPWLSVLKGKVEHFYVPVKDLIDADAFYEAMKERGYNFEIRKTSMEPFAGEQVVDVLAHSKAGVRIRRNIDNWNVIGRQNWSYEAIEGISPEESSIAMYLSSTKEPEELLSALQEARVRYIRSPHNLIVIPAKDVGCTAIRKTQGTWDVIARELWFHSNTNGDEKLVLVNDGSAQFQNIWKACHLARVHFDQNDKGDIFIPAEIVQGIVNPAMRIIQSKMRQVSTAETVVMPKGND